MNHIRYVHINYNTLFSVGLLCEHFDRNLWEEFQIWIAPKTCDNLLNKSLVDSVLCTMCFEVGLSGEGENRH